MKISAEEFNKLQYLLGKYRLDSLTQLEQQELRTLVGKENSYAINEEVFKIEDLVDLGLIMVGVNVVEKILKEYYNANPSA